MKHFISSLVKVILRRLHNAEHTDFYESGIIAPLESLMNSLPMISGIFNALKTTFQREDALYKQSQASIQTRPLRALHEKRIAFYEFFWYSVNMFKFYDDPPLMQAAEQLKFLRKTYKGMTHASYSDANGLMTAFLEDCEAPVWKPLIQTLGLTLPVDKMRAAHNKFKDYYNERSFNKEHLAQMGKFSLIRVEVDDAFVTVLENINAAWTINEYGLQDEAIRNTLLEVKEHISAAIHQARLNFAHRNVRHKRAKADAGAQTPDAGQPATDKPGEQINQEKKD
ncbi:MAG: DUF6261 family protein [Tannerellaceae bacterium]|nr:DUF6261 family protein [Tannerellaceae bacterium]